MNGFGTYTHIDGRTYTGEWVRDQRSGRGRERYSDGSYYEGEFFQGCEHGQGVFKSATNEVVFEGQMQHDKMHGTGCHHFADGRVYSGQWEKGHMNGEGEMIWPDMSDLGEAEDTMNGTNLRAYKGQWCNGKQDGNGTVQNVDGTVASGPWKNGVLIAVDALSALTSSAGEIEESKKERFAREALTQGNWDPGDLSESLLEPTSKKTIGFAGSVMLLINTIAGPTIVSMPALAQEAGWLPLLLVEVGVACFCVLCGLMVIDAMRRMPGNDNFQRIVEFTDFTSFYLPRPLHYICIFCFFLACALNLMQLIIQSAQVTDYILLNVNGCAPGLDIGNGLRYVCGSKTDSVTPFGDSFVLSSSMLIAAVVCVPFAIKDLDGNIVLQKFAVVGLCVMALIWVIVLVEEPAFPTPLPLATTSQRSLIGTVLFNFSFIATVPSWVNEKRPDVSVAETFGATMVYVVLVYSIIGIMGGLAFAPFFQTDENLFSKLNASGSMMGQATVWCYPMLQNFTSIPIQAILIRHNLTRSGIPKKVGTCFAVALPWALSVYFYTGKGFDIISEFGGLATSSVINFVLPVMMYLVAAGRNPRDGRPDFLRAFGTMFSWAVPAANNGSRDVVIGQP
eukprot:TRINITY_DN5527_c0_g7_i1.p1 TRINITY_DN5527_c0_g7~~TRINITY_DN5527_c0_g7_i1.p1  ORF type:complete len:729 (+),score=94.57 TRINITY_DN5527_c0_g7_i1:328-2187(+)